MSPHRWFSTMLVPACALLLLSACQSQVFKTSTLDQEYQEARPYPALRVPADLRKPQNSGRYAIPAVHNKRTGNMNLQPPDYS